MIAIATTECGEANNHEFRYPYIFGSMLANYYIDMKTSVNFALK